MNSKKKTHPDIRWAFAWSIALASCSGVENQQDRWRSPSEIDVQTLQGRVPTWRIWRDGTKSKVEVTCKGDLTSEQIVLVDSRHRLTLRDWATGAPQATVELSFQPDCLQINDKDIFVGGQVAGSGTGRLACVSSETKTIRWEQDISDPGDAIDFSPKGGDLHE